SMAGTCFSGISHNKPEAWKFHPGGKLEYFEAPRERYGHASWRQYGCVITMETNDHYADYIGVVAGDRVGGRATNVKSLDWRWRGRRSDPHALRDVFARLERSVKRLRKLRRRGG